MKNLTNQDVDNMVAEVSDMITGVILNLDDNQVAVAAGEKLVWFSVNHTLDSGTGIMMYFSIKDGIKKAWVKLNKGAVSKLHFHEDMIETFRVVEGKLSYKLYYTANEQDIKDEGVLDENSEITIDSGVWHRVFTTLEDTFLEATFKVNKK